MRAAGTRSPVCARQDLLTRQLTYCAPEFAGSQIRADMWQPSSRSAFWGRPETAGLPPCATTVDHTTRGATVKAVTLWHC